MKALTRGLGAEAAARALKRRREKAGTWARGHRAESPSSSSQSSLEESVLGIGSSRSTSVGGSASTSQSSTPAKGAASLVLNVTLCLPIPDGEQETTTLTVELSSSATVALLKARIEELYGIPAQAQKLQHSPDPKDEGFADRVSVSWAARLGTLYLLTTPQQSHHSYDFQSDEEVEPAHLSVQPQRDGRSEVLQHAQQAIEEIAQGLHGITYHVHIMRPILVAGSVERQMMTLEADAMCIVSDLLDTAEREFFGEAGHPAILVTDEGRELPLELPLHFAGVRDGETLIITRRIPVGSASFASEEADEEDSDDAFDCYMQLWAARA